MSIFPRKSSALTQIPMREFLERIVDERDKQYDARFRAAEIAVSAALSAQEKSTKDAFLASEKAIIKAEDAQREYNARSNEFRGQLDDQAKTLMPRPETTALFRAVDEKLIVIQSNYERRLEVLQSNIEKINESLVKEIAGLREYRSETSGKTIGANALWGYLVGAAGVILAVIFHFVK